MVRPPFYREAVTDLPAIARRARPWLVLMAIALALASVSSRGSPDASGGDAGSAPAPPAAPAARSAALSPTQRAIAGVLRHSAFVARGGGRRREIALTFDDGPGPYTPGVLIALNRLSVKATFFVVGRQEQAFRTAMMAAIGRGHVIGDHTENHSRLARLAPLEQYAEMLGPLHSLAQFGLPRPQLFRPPYGSYNDATFEGLRRLGMLMVLWSVDSRDYARPGVRQIVDRVVGAARPGAIVLMHDGGGDRSQTIAAIPKIVKRLRAKHYRFVTVPQLLRDDPPPAGRIAPRVPIDER
jgi:peptidoglycan/xylan/chitin deacetylase (PgdA/CDA1 family)